MSEHTRENELDVLTYNVWLRPSYFIDGQRARVRELARYLQGHDVLVLCETFAKNSSRYLFDTLRQYYPHQTGVLGAPRLFAGEGVRMGNGGVTILSRWPIVARDERSFGRLLKGPDAYADKGVLYACINKGGQVYHLFGSHTQAPPEPAFRAAYKLARRDADRAYRELRLEQFAVIGRFVRELRIPANEPVVIAGDLNTDKLGAPQEFEQMLERLDAAFPQRVSGRPGTWEPAANPLSTGQLEWLDYVLWSRSHLQPESSQLEVRAIRSQNSWRRLPGGREYNDLSDHHAVRAVFVFPERRAREAHLGAKLRRIA